MLSRIATIAMFAGMIMLTACLNVQPTEEPPVSDMVAPTLTPTEVIPVAVRPEETNTPVSQPTRTRAPTWTPIPTATPEPTPTFTPMPTPTPHPCSLAVIEPADELQLVYTRYLAADPTNSGISPSFREALHNLFPRIAAAYVIEFIANPTRYASFRDYLLREGLRAADADIAAGFQALQDWDFVPSVGESLYNYNQRRASDPCTPARSRIFADDGSMTLLAVGYAISTISPSLRDFAIDVTIRDINAFRFQDVTTPLIFWILEELVE